MKKQNSLRVALMCGVAGGLLLASCTDSDYDLSKDIDLTMGLGSQGLALKLGSTQNVYLRDFFTVDDSEMLDTLGSGMYYLIQDGQASVPVDVNEIAQTDDIFNVDLNADIDVLSGGTLVPAGDVEATGVTASEPVQVNLKDIPEEILSIRRVSPEDPIEMSIELIVDQPGRAAFGLKEMRDMKIEFPSYIYSSQYEEGTHTISVPDRTFSGDRSFRISGIKADSIVMGGSDAFGQEVVGGTLATPNDEVENITMTGTFVLTNGTEIQLGADERVGIRLSIAISSIRTGEITGQVSPGIEPDIEPIDISSDLPDFLQDESVSLHMTNPMMGLRGCRLDIVYPEIGVMQATAVIKAALRAEEELHKRTGKKVHITASIMVPQVVEAKELKYVKKLITDTADKIIAESTYDNKLKYIVGTMIETPRSTITAGDLAAEAAYFSYGTNDLTQFTYGFSRNDYSSFVTHYIDKKILDFDPFKTVDTTGVGRLVALSIKEGKAANPDLHCGICGEVGGDPESIEFFYRAGADYVSCSPFRVPGARLAAAQAVIHAEGKYKY